MTDTLNNLTATGASEMRDALKDCTDDQVHTLSELALELKSLEFELRCLRLREVQVVADIEGLRKQLKVEIEK